MYVYTVSHLTWTAQGGEEPGRTLRPSVAYVVKVWSVPCLRYSMGTPKGIYFCVGRGARRLPFLKSFASRARDRGYVRGPLFWAAAPCGNLRLARGQLELPGGLHKIFASWRPPQPNRLTHKPISAGTRKNQARFGRIFLRLQCCGLT